MKLCAAVVVLLVVQVFAVSTGPSSGIFPANFKVSVAASSVDGQYNISLVENTGTLNVRGQSYTALAYWTQVMGIIGESTGVWWINIVGIADDGSNLAIVYLDCTDGTLNEPFWEEDWDTFLFQTPIERSQLQQSCNFDLVDWSIPVSFPSLNALPSTGFDTGITISGDQISFNSNAGWFLYNNKNFTVIPISTVMCDNCATNCGSYNTTSSVRERTPVPYKYGCYPGPWYEIHHAAHLAGDGTTPDTICFGIFYLFTQDHTFLQWNYTFCMPEISSPMVLFDANWSGTLNSNRINEIPNLNLGGHFAATTPTADLNLEDTTSEATFNAPRGEKAYSTQRSKIENSRRDY